MKFFHQRFGIPGVIAVCALVFAMLGGAYAASNGGDGATASAKRGKPGPRGKRGPTGPTGPTGAAGAAGPQGAAGAAGAKGATGATGTNGTNGTNGKSVTVTEIPADEPECAELGGALVEETGNSASAVEVCNGDEGEKGEKGEKGEPWSPNSTLPPEAMLTGAWSFNGAGEHRVSISFPIRLPAAVEEGFAHFGSVGEGEFTAAGACPGGFSNPQPKPGHLCVFKTGFNEATFSGFAGPGGAETPGRPGGFLIFQGESATASGEGSWAYKAPAP